MKRIAAILFLSSIAFAAKNDTLVFSFFREPGDDGLYLATSKDGIHWTPLNNDKPLFKPEIGESKLMRDPSIAAGPDGTFHLVWTTSWQGKTLGHASSKDLKNWSAQQTITPFPEGTEVQNCWAPELFYDAPSKDYVIIWASTIRGTYPQTLGTASKDNNHRIYVIRTKDWKTFTAPKVFYDPGFIVIDATLFKDGKRYGMLVKNETQFPTAAKNIFLTYADSLDGPWTKPSAPFSGNGWAEGPTIIRIGDKWYVYFDKYRDKIYGVMRTNNLTGWEDITKQASFPPGIKHGTAFYAPSAIVEKLK